MYVGHTYRDSVVVPLSCRYVLAPATAAGQHLGGASAMLAWRAN